MKLGYQALVLVAVLLLSACSADISDYRSEQPQLKLEQFFQGDLIAYGTVQDYSGKVIQRFRVELQGSWDGDQGELAEQFYYADGRQQERVWKLRKTGPDSYEGRAGDVEGVASGQVAGNAFHWTYDLEVEVDGEPMVLGIDDWMYLVDENNLINRSKMYKYGLPVGEITLYIGRR
ncbi:DUF3833 domain-containing protein [Idiomarina xiamenensis]|uniref:Lipoprotein n=1 Tax=Idiomarina xiamenensis 10-D-4 TaxID=740709 RepID=K2KFX3_9GAMM|nr:DUF3833 domain-containing protein [Idiomarina xiamenensis]EKE86908.1 hypothetical protein A10D4_01662 [Idiomarina xiamenensis 10-D-4]